MTMRIDEIASAEDQIALFKLITDKVWQALGDQQQADAEAKAQQPLKAKLKAGASAKHSTPRHSAQKAPAFRQLPTNSVQRQQTLSRTRPAKPQPIGMTQKNLPPSENPSNGSIEAV